MPRQFLSFFYNNIIILVQSTLLQCLLQELPVTSGTIDINGSIAYASQESWIFSATIRDNILFGLPYDSLWYNTVLEACALDKVLVLTDT